MLNVPHFHDINGYTANGAQTKERFLTIGRKLLDREMKPLLAAKGYTEADCHCNRGGIAVSGEVVARYFKPGVEVGIEAWWSESVVANTNGDRVSVMYRWTERNHKGRHTATGPNYFWYPKRGENDLAPLAEAMVKQAEIGQKTT